jgi:oxygen-independent coproporphyrinogen-3 oxidase
MAAALGAAGVTRASLGVQSFDPAVQRSINRVQSLEQTAGATERLRAAGVRGINIDLVYGLPRQTTASCIDTGGSACSFGRTASRCSATRMCLPSRSTSA